VSGGSNRLAALAADIRAAHQDSTRAAITLAERALAAGTALIEAKRLVAYGEWQPWLRENCGLSERTARRYMVLAASGLKTATVAVLGIRGASEALGRVSASEEKTGAKGDREVPAAPKQTRTDHHVGSQTAGVTASATLDLESGERDAVNRADPQDLFPDPNRECASKQRRQRNKRSRWLPQTGEEEFVERLTNFLNSDDWQQVRKKFRSLDPKDVIRVAKKGPMLRVQR
jgi:hypothetical protein